MDYQELKDLYIEKKTKRDMLRSTYKNIKIKYKKAKHESQLIEKAQAFLQKVAKETQEQLRFQITDIVNMALDACFPGLKFEIEFEIKRGKTEAEFVFKQGSHIIDDPMNGLGGGVIDLTAFALRIATLTIGTTDNVVILDEPFKFLQPKELHQKGLQMIKQISHMLGIQFIINSNSVQGGDIANIADKLFETKIRNGITEMTERGI